ncbi:hypothetical protein Hanom_Chr08g00683311 [Helianthus anomalus]
MNRKIFYTKFLLKYITVNYTKFQRMSFGFKNAGNHPLRLKKPCKSLFKAKRHPLKNGVNVKDETYNLPYL